MCGHHAAFHDPDGFCRGPRDNCECRYTKPWDRDKTHGCPRHPQVICGTMTQHTLEPYTEREFCLCYHGRTAHECGGGACCDCNCPGWRRAVA